MTTPTAEGTHTLPSGTWRLDPASTTITVTARKLGLISVPATLTMTTGTVVIDADHQVTDVEVVADAGSYKTSIDKRDEHVRSSDFLDVDNHPTLVFRAGQVTAAPGGYRSAGSVSVKGETFPLTVDISSVVVGDRSASFVATATIDRAAIGVDKFPSFFIGRNLQLTVAATAALAED